VAMAALSSLSKRAIVLRASFGRQDGVLVQ
jgi:hypothetical protein